LVTAGATRNPVDAMRYLSACSSGGTGAWLADRLAPADLLGSPEALLRTGNGQPFGSTRDLLARMERWVRAHPGGVVVHAAAVGDYEVAADASKIPSGQPALTLTLTPTPKVIDHVLGWDPGCRLVGFKAAAPGTTPSELERIARALMDRTGAVAVFCNVIGDLDATCALADGASFTPFATRQEALEALAKRIDALRSD